MSADDRFDHDQDPDGALAGSESPGDPRLGERLAARYLVQRKLGVGGMGAVYEALDERIGRSVAVKFLRGDYTGERRMLRRFQQEVTAACSARSDHIIDVTDVGKAADGAPFLVMDLLDGSDLRTVLRGEPVLSVPRAAAIGVQICRGLAAVHAKGIVHRDLKPENLFVTPHGDGAEHVTILDFGVAKLVESEAFSCATVTGSVLGTPCYMAPEQVRGARAIDYRTDLYALGIILYECLAGRTPFTGERTAVMYQIVHEPAPPLEVLRPELPPALVGLIARTMAKDPANRPGSAAELALALGPFAQLGTPAPAWPRDLVGGVTITSAGTHAAPPLRDGGGHASNRAPRDGGREETERGLAATTLGLRRTRSFAVAAGAGVLVLLAGTYWWRTPATPTETPTELGESIPRAARVAAAKRGAPGVEPGSLRGGEPAEDTSPVASGSSDAAAERERDGKDRARTTELRGTPPEATRPVSRSSASAGRTAAQGSTGRTDVLPFDRENPY